MTLMWKLLRKNVSVPQLAGYVAAGFIGLTIILFGLQFYFDTRPIFTSNESFFKPDYLTVSKRVSALSSNNFSQKEIEDLKNQKFVKKVAFFTSSKYAVDAYISTSSYGGLSTQMFFESVPDEFLDVDSKKWKWQSDSAFIPIIIPKDYVSLYNFGFAQTQGLPQISENIIENVKFGVTISGNGNTQKFNSRIVGFSDKLNTILVPQAFMEWANSRFGNAKSNNPSRLLVETYNPGDPAIAEYFGSKKYETGDKTNTGKAAYFLRLVIVAVLLIGLIITLLAVALMLLSISLLMYKNRDKLENLMLLGYSRKSVARPYQQLSFALTLVIFALAFIVVLLLRNFYINKIALLFDKFTATANVFAIFGIGFIILLVICAVNSIWINRKLVKISENTDKQ